MIAIISLIFVTVCNVILAAMMIVQVKHNKRLRIQAKMEKLMHDTTRDILMIAIRENDRLRAENKRLKAENGGNEEGS